MKTIINTNITPDYRIKLNRKYSGDLPELAAGKDKWFLFKFKVTDYDEQTVRAIANKAYKEGYDVELFRLDVVDGAWQRTDLGTAKHQKSTETKPASKKSKKSSGTKKPEKKVVAPVASAPSATEAKIAELETKVTNLEKVMGDLATAVTILVNKLEATEKKPSSKQSKKA